MPPKRCAQAGREHGTLRIACSLVAAAEGQHLLLRFTDDGVGIAPEHLPRIFENGFSTKSRATNFGIGLHWCANALNALGGSIRAESAGPTGATLQVLVPLRQAPARAGCPGRLRPLMATNNRQPIRVLVVDDEPAVLDAYRQVLGKAASSSADREAMDELRAQLFVAGAGAPTTVGSVPQRNQFEPVFCNGAEAAVTAVREACGAGRPFAVVFLDMRMPPGPDGIWAAERIREIDPQVEIVICTAYSDVDPMEISRRVPPEDKLFYLQKPFHPHEVRQMALALGEKRANEEHRLAQVEDFDPLTGAGQSARASSRT